MEAARSGMVLLKNDGDILPLDKSRIKSIAVIGPDAYSAQVGGGGSAESETETVYGGQLPAGSGTLSGNGVTMNYARGIPTLQDTAKQTEFLLLPTAANEGLRLRFSITRKSRALRPLSAPTNICFISPRKVMREPAATFRSDGPDTSLRRQRVAT